METSPGFGATMNLHLITVPYHMGQKDTAVGLGPARFLEGGLGPVAQSSGHTVTIVPIDEGFAARIEAVNSAVTGAVARAISARAFPLVVAGNCNSCLGTLPALNPAGLGIVWLDAHGDYHSRETSISGNLDGMALGFATARHVDESRTVLLGVRDLDPGEKDRIASSRMHVVPAAEWRDGFVSKNLPPADRIYLHIDIDVIDAAINPGVNFRGSGGLSLQEVEHALRIIGGRYSIAAAALTNYNPDRDVDWKTRDLGLRLVRLLCTML
jgi:arginase